VSGRRPKTPRNAKGQNRNRNPETGPDLAQETDVVPPTAIPGAIPDATVTNPKNVDAPPVAARVPPQDGQKNPPEGLGVIPPEPLNVLGTQNPRGQVRSTGTIRGLGNNNFSHGGSLANQI
jgi:hypothetical protein